MRTWLFAVRKLFRFVWCGGCSKCRTMQSADSSIVYAADVLWWTLVLHLCIVACEVEFVGFNHVDSFILLSNVDMRAWLLVSVRWSCSG